MRRQCLVIACSIVLGLTMAAWGDPFSEVPSGHWSYAACSRLVACGVLPADRATGFSGRPALTRFEFATALLDPLSEVERALPVSHAKPDAKAMANAAAGVIAANPRVPDAEAAKAASDLARLGTEFAGELRSLSFDPADAVRALQLASDPSVVRMWRAQTFARPARPEVATLTDGLRVPVGHGAVALGYDRSLRAPLLLDYLAAASSNLTSATPGGATGAGTALSDPLVSRLRTAYEYGLGPALTLSLGREQISRQGQDKAPLDAAWLTSFGVGYRFAPSASVKVSYSLLNYQNYTSDAPPVRERMAETSVSVEF